MTVNSYPLSIEELVSSAWIYKIQKTVSNFRLKEDVEDTVSAIIASMIEKDYLAKWDKEKGGSFSSWIYVFVLNHCRNKLARSRSKAGRVVEGALRIENSTKFFEDGSDRVSAEHLSAPDLVGDNRIFAKELLEVIRQRQKKAFSKVVYTETGYIIFTRNGERVEYSENQDSSLAGRAFRRDWETIYMLLLEGFKVSEISYFLKTSVQYVRTQFHGIRALSEAVAAK